MVAEKPDTLITWYLEMTDRAQFVPAHLDVPMGVTILEMENPDIPYYRFLYDTVGDTFGWRDRRLMTDDELRAAITRAGVTIYVMYQLGVPCGYVELLAKDVDDQRVTEIAYLGLRPEYHGRGYGKFLLSFGIAQAWEDGADRVTLHTCNLDSESALPNYLKRGFQITRTEEEPMPDRYKT